MPQYTDQTGRIVEIPPAPRRIISLVPSQTELLASLGLEEEVVGITKFCTHPAAWFHAKTRIGGTKTLRLDLIRQLKPDLIIANKEENKIDQIEMLEADFPVWASDVNKLSDALEMIRLLGEITNRREKADEIAGKIGQSFEGLPALQKGASAVYLIWQQPWMAAGHSTFINDMLERLGFINLAATLGQRYPTIPQNVLATWSPDYIFLSSEPFPFGQKHLELLQEKFPESNIQLVDGTLFSWYGSRLLKSAAYFQSLMG